MMVGTIVGVPGPVMLGPQIKKRVCDAEPEASEFSRKSYMCFRGRSDTVGPWAGREPSAPTVEVSTA